MTTTVPGPALSADDTPSEVVASVRGLTVSLSRNGRRANVLRDIDLDIRSGEILGLVGESGSGKSVLSLALLGLLPEASAPQVTGSITVAGTDMVSSSAATRRANRRQHMGAVFQDPMTSLNPTMKVGRQVAEAAGSGAEALRLLKAVGIPQAERRLDSFPHELSGGLRQRVMIAMAVAGDPALVIADEPTTALDVTVQAQVLALLARLRDEVGCSVLLITHDLGVAAQVADRVAVMYAGRIAELGATTTLLRQPAHPYTVGLMRSRLSLTTDRDKPLLTLEGGAPDPAKLPSGCAYNPRCPAAFDQCREVVPDPLPLAEDDRVDAAHLRACFAAPTTVRALALVDGEHAASEIPPMAAAPETVVVADVETPAVPVTPGDLDDAPEAAAPEWVARISRVDKVFRVKAGRGRRAKLHALRGVSLEVAPGESVAIVGESGSGKSTMLRVLAGLERATSGEVELGNGPAPQMVFQDAGASLTPWMTVGKLIAERLRADGMPRDQWRPRILEVLARVGLPEAVADAKAAELSGGQRQRVALARATVVPPQVLLCDEPTSALDVSLAASVLNLVQELRRDLNMSVLFVTHDLSVARIVADRIAVMYLGRIVEIGAADEVIARPKHPYTKALLSAVPDFGVAPAALAGEPASPLSPPSGCAFHPRCPLALPACASDELDVPLDRLRVGIDGLRDASLRRVACIRPEEL